MKHPNILFLFTDQHRKSALGFWSRPEYRDGLLGESDPVHTPNLDRLAEESIVVSNAYSSYPVCSPFRAMLFSGRYPENNGVWQNCAPGRRDELRSDISTFTDILSDSGYSVGYVGKWHLERPEADFDRDGNYIGDDPSYEGERYFPDGSHDDNTVCWDTLIPRGRQRKMDYLYAYNTWDIFRAEADMPLQKRPHYWDKNQNRVTAPEGVWSPDFETDLAIDFLKNEKGERNAEAPFALFVSYNPPHSPYTSRADTDIEAYDQHYSREQIPQATDLLKRKNVTLENEKFLEQARVYFSHVTGIDRCIGRILDALTPEQAENTVVIFTADHGEMLGSHGLMAKNVPYEEATAIPFLIRYPGKLAHRCEPLFLSGADILPTVLSLAEIEIPDEIEGKDYFFLTKEAFQVDIKSKKITEWDFCLNNYYGFSHDTLQGTRVITHALSRMAIRIKEKNPQEVTTIFLMPQNKDKIFSNLNQIYKGDDLLLRKALVEEEICHSVLFDEIITVSDSAIELLYDESVKKIILNTKKRD